MEPNVGCKFVKKKKKKILLFKIKNIWPSRQLWPPFSTDASVNGQPVQWLVQWFTVSGQHRQTISITPAQSFAVTELSASDPVYYMLIRDGPFHSSKEDPLFKDSTLRLSSVMRKRLRWIMLSYMWGKMMLKPLKSVAAILRYIAQ